jgi:hypothetical protein
MYWNQWKGETSQKNARDNLTGSETRGCCQENLLLQNQPSISDI